MDTNQEILNELRSLRRQAQVGTFLSVILVAVVIAYVTWSRMEQQRASQSKFQSRTAAPRQNAAQGTQEDTNAMLDRGDYQTALSNALSFVARQPVDHYAHASLGWVYVAMGDFTNAEAAYLRAVELFPSEDNEKALTAIRKRLARDRGTEARVR